MANEEKCPSCGDDVEFVVANRVHGFFRAVIYTACLAAGGGTAVALDLDIEGSLLMKGVVILPFLLAMGFFQVQWTRTCPACGVTAKADVGYGKRL